MPGEIAARGFVDKLNDVILFPIIFLLSSVALLIFMWGAFKYIANANNEQARAEGKRSMFYGIIGLLVMVSAYALLSIAAGTFGLRATLDGCADIGDAPCITAPEGG